MASITKTTTKGGVARYRVRYRTPDRRQREKWFDRKSMPKSFVPQQWQIKHVGPG